MRTLAALILLALTLTACGGEDAESKPAADEGTEIILPSFGDGPIWPSSGKPLSHYEGGPTYEFRVNLLANQEYVDDRLAGLGFGQDNYDDLISTCDSIARGSDDAAVLAATTTRFGVDDAMAEAVVAVAKKGVCG